MAEIHHLLTTLAQLSQGLNNWAHQECHLDFQKLHLIQGSKITFKIKGQVRH